MGTRLFVGNLSYQTNEGELLDLFKEAGTVASCHVMMDKFTNKSRGFAFVEMGTPEAAEKAITMFHERELDGRNLVVNEARPREDRPRNGFGGASSRFDRRPDRRMRVE